METHSDPGILPDPIVILSWPSTTPLDTTSDKFETALRQPFDFVNVQRTKLRLVVRAKTSDVTVATEVKLLVDGNDVVTLSTNSDVFEVLTSDAIDFPKLAATSLVEIQYRITKAGPMASVEGAVVQLEV